MYGRVYGRFNTLFLRIEYYKKDHFTYIQGNRKCRSTGDLKILSDVH